MRAIKNRKKREQECASVTNLGCKVQKLNQVSSNRGIYHEEAYVPIMKNSRRICSTFGTE